MEENTNTQNIETGAGVNQPADNNQNENKQTPAAKTFTQAEVDKIISDRLGKEKARWEKTLQEQKTEAEKLAKMQENERLQYELKKREDAVNAKEKEITTRELKAAAYETLASKGLPKDLISTLDFSDADACNASIERVEKIFNGAVEKMVNEKLKGKTPGASGANTGGKLLSKEEIAELSKKNGPKWVNENYELIKKSLAQYDKK